MRSNKLKTRGKNDMKPEIVKVQRKVKKKPQSWTPEQIIEAAMPRKGWDKKLNKFSASKSVTGKLAEKLERNPLSKKQVKKKRDNFLKAFNDADEIRKREHGEGKYSPIECRNSPEDDYKLEQKAYAAGLEEFKSSFVPNAPLHLGIDPETIDPPALDITLDTGLRAGFEQQKGDAILSLAEPLPERFEIRDNVVHNCRIEREFDPNSRNEKGEWIVTRLALGAAFIVAFSIGRYGQEPRTQTRTIYRTTPQTYDLRSNPFESNKIPLTTNQIEMRREGL